MILGLTFTYPISLETWVKTGLIDREKQIYEEHLKQQHFKKVIWFTYGRNDKKIRDKLVAEQRLDERIEVVGRPWWTFGKILRWLYAQALPWIKRKECSELTIVKTNQMGGSYVAARISRKYSIPLELRTGYTYSIFSLKKYGYSSSVTEKLKYYWGYKYYGYLEKRMYGRCNIAALSSKEDCEYVISKYKVEKDKVFLLTNYINCDAFSIKSISEKRKNRLLFVGRLSKQKNLINLLLAVKQTNIGIDIYGDGEQKQELLELIEKENIDAKLYGYIENHQLPEKYNQYRYFILPSDFEGMPKSLLEAMACGCVCIGTDVEGIREVIFDGTTGYLLENGEVETIRAGIDRVMNCQDTKVGYYAQQFIVENHSLLSVTQREWQAIKAVIR